MPIIHFHLAEGRYDEARQRRLLIECDCWPIPPEDWAIGGTSASVARAAEVAARAATV